MKLSALKLYNCFPLEIRNNPRTEAWDKWRRTFEEFAEMEQDNGPKVREFIRIRFGLKGRDIDKYLEEIHKINFGKQFLDVLKLDID